MADNLYQRYASGDSNTAGPIRLKEIDGVLYAVSILADSSGTLWDTVPVSAASLPLPSGAATSANQATIIGYVDGIEITLGTIAAAVSGTEMQVDVVSMPTVTIQDGDGSITVDGTVAATQSGTWTVGVSGTVAVTDNSGSLTVDAAVNAPVFVRLSDGTSPITTLPVSLASVPSHAVTNAGTFAVQVDGTALTRLTDIETNTDSGAVVGNGTAATAQRVTLANDSTGIVSLTTSTASIGKLAANAGVTIGAVEIAAAQTLATVTTVATCSTVTTLTGGAVAHDSADAGNPIKVGGRAAATLSDDTMIANGDRSDVVNDLDGTLLVRSGFPLGDLVSERVTDTGGNSTAFTNFGATASTRNYVTAIVVYNASATAGYVDFRDGTGGSVLFTVPIPAGGGAVVAMGGVPLFRTSANTALAYDVSGALTTVYISVSGFRSKV